MNGVGSRSTEYSLRALRGIGCEYLRRAGGVYTAQGLRAAEVLVHLMLQFPRASLSSVHTMCLSCVGGVYSACAWLMLRVLFSLLIRWTGAALAANTLHVLVS